MRFHFVHGLVAVILLSLVFSCKSSNDVVSNKRIQKRKYRKGFYVDKKKKKKEERDEKTIALLSEKAVVENEKADMNPILTSTINNDNRKELKTNKSDCKTKEIEFKKLSRENNQVAEKEKSNKLNVKHLAFKEKIIRGRKRKMEPFGLISFLLLITFFVSFIVLGLASAGAAGGGAVLGIALLIILGLSLVFSIISLIRFKKNPTRYRGKVFQKITFWFFALLFAAAAVILILGLISGL